MIKSFSSDIISVTNLINNLWYLSSHVQSPIPFVLVVPLDQIGDIIGLADNTIMLERFEKVDLCPSQLVISNDRNKMDGWLLLKLCLDQETSWGAGKESIEHIPKCL